MKQIILAVILFATFSVAVDTNEKLWVSIQYSKSGDRVLFIQDLETGTRCYAVTSNLVSTSGYAISCVEKK